MPSLFSFSWGVYDAAAFLIPVSCRSFVCTNCYTIIYGLAYCIQTQQRILELKETENYGLRFLLQLKGNWFRNNLFINFSRIHWGFLYTKMHRVHRFNKFWISSLDISLWTVFMVFASIPSKTWNDLIVLFFRYNEKSSIFLGKELYWS